MAINKNFVVKNGIEVNTNLIVADTDSNKVGIGTTVPEYTLHVFEGTGIGASTINVTGVGTFLEELNVGLAGTTLTVLSNITSGIGGSVGVGTELPAYLVDIRSPVSTGQTALYVQGDMRVTGDINIDDISIGDINVSGISTFVGNVIIGTAATVGFGSTAFFKDHAKAIFGDGEDLKIYHDGSNSYISDTGTGGLIFGSNSLTVKNAALNETQAVFTENGAVELYYDNTKRFETNAIGVEVSGTFESTGITTLASDAGITTTGGDLYVGGDLYINEDVILDTNLTILGIATIGVLQVSSTSGINTIYSTVQSTSKDTGSLVLEGGLGVEKSVFIGDGLDVTGIATVHGGSIDIANAVRHIGDPDTHISFPVNDEVKIQTGGSARLTIGSGGISTFSGVIDANDTTQSSSSTTGAAKFAGGVGIEKNLYVGGGQVTTGIHTITDLRVGTQLPGQTLVGITTILDEDNMSSNSATALATQQSIKAYVDTQLTAEDLDFGGDSGTGSVDLDSQTFTIAGTANEIETTASSQTLTIGLPNDVTIGQDFTVTRNAVVTGIATFSDTVEVPSDSKKILLGAGKEMQVFHDGTDSLIKDTRNSGSVKIQADNFSVIDKDASETMLSATVDGAVTLRHNGNTKFETTGAGVTVTGVGTFSQSISIASSVYHLSDDNTHFGFPAADTFTVYTAGSEALRVDSSQRLLIGASGASNLIRHGQAFAVATTDEFGGGSFTGFNGTTANEGPIIDLQRSRATSKSPGTVVVDDDRLGSLVFRGDDGTDFADAAYMLGEVDGTPSGGFVPGRLTFFTGTASATPIERLRITSNGKVGINTNDPQGTLQINDGLNGLEFNVNSNNAVVAYNRTSSSYLPVGLQGSSVKLNIGGTGTILDANASGTITTGINTSGGFRATGNNTPLDGQGLEIFCPDTSSAQIQSFDRANSQTDKLIIRGNPIELKDSSNTVRLEVNSSGVVNTGITTFSGTSHIKVPVGTTAQRPSGVAGDFRYNTTTGNFEGYTDEWGAIAGSGGASESDTTVSSTSATSIYTTAHATNRSVSAIIQITQGTSYQVGRYLVIHDGTTATIVEESAVATGDMLGSFTADINGSNLRILVNMASASSATVTIVPTVVTV